MNEEIHELVSAAREVQREQVQLGHERDDETADYLAEGWEESAAYSNEIAEQHWRAVAALGFLAEVVERLASELEDEAPGFGRSLTLTCGCPERHYNRISLRTSDGPEELAVVVRHQVEAIERVCR